MSILNLNNVSLQLPKMPKPVINQISYDMKQGDFIILLGGNGSGKSTLMKLLYRDYAPTTGTITFDQRLLSDYSSKQLSDKIAVLTQNTQDSLFMSLTLYENYLLNLRNRHATADHRAFLTDYLQKFNPNLSHKLDQVVDQFSGGERQALALAFCLLKKPSLLLLDEHTSALDPKTSKQIMQLTYEVIKEHHISCILTTHDLDIALQYGNRILVLRDGEIHQTYDKSTHQTLTKELLINSCYE